MDQSKNFQEDELSTWAEEDSSNTGISPSMISAGSQLRFIRTTRDYDIAYLPQALKEKIQIAPDYQRRSRWDINQKSRLIESLLMNIPIPPVFLFESEFDTYEVVDGRQRLEAIKGFLADEYALKNLEFFVELNGKKYSKLTEEVQRSLKRRSISAILLLAESSKPSESEFDVRLVLFERLNTGGVKLNRQEIRNSIFRGKFLDLLFELSELESFRKIWGIPIIPVNRTEKEYERSIKNLEKNQVYKTMLDCELVLRFFAVKDVWENPEKPKGSMSYLLDSSIIRHRYSDGDKISRLRGEFTKSIEFFYINFGDDCFVNKWGGGVAKTARNLYDSLLVAYASIVGEGGAINEDVDMITMRLDEEMSDSANYEMVITKGNSVEAIIQRVGLMRSILQEDSFV
jgi:hypothetical protein